MKNYLLLYSRFFIIIYFLISILTFISCHNDSKTEDATSKGNLTQIIYATNDIKSFKLYSPTSFKFYPWTINTTVYPGVSFPDNSVLKVNSDLSWASSNENIIKPVDGLIVALNEGVADLYARWSVSNLSTSSKLTVASPDKSVEDYKNWQFKDIDFENYEIISTIYEDTNSITLYWNDPYYLTTSYIIAYSNTTSPTDCTTEEENKTIVELDLSKTDLQEDSIEVSNEYAPHFMYHYTIRDLDYSKTNSFILCKKQSISVIKNNETKFSTYRLTGGIHFYLLPQIDEGD